MGSDQSGKGHIGLEHLFVTYGIDAQGLAEKGQQLDIEEGIMLAYLYAVFGYVKT
jgi:hypothetical protein